MLFGSFPAGLTPRALRAWQRILLVLRSNSRDTYALPENVLENQYYKQLTLSFGCDRFNHWVQVQFLSYLEGKHRWALWTLSAPLLVNLLKMDRSLRRLCLQDWKRKRSTEIFRRQGIGGYDTRKCILIRVKH